MIVPDLLTQEARAERFFRISRSAMTERRRQGTDGIGTLAEKWQHQIIKRYLSEDPADHEILLPGTRFVSDLRVGQDAYEVQTGAFAPMKKKIAYYLQHTDLTVTVVHPIPQTLWVSRIDYASGNITSRRKSPLHGKPEDLLPELYPLIPFLPDPRLRFRILMVEAEEFRILLTAKKGGRSARASKFERIPVSLLDDISLKEPSDFLRFLPASLPPVFTAKIFAQSTKLRGINAYSAIRVLCALGLAEETAPVGRAMAWKLAGTNGS